MSVEFLVTSLIVVIAPGTGVLYTLATGLARGARARIAAAFGCTLGIVPHMAAAITGLAALLHGLVAVGAARRRAWAWAVGVLIAGATLVGAAYPFRGVISAVGIVLAGLELGLLLTRDGRRLMRDGT